MSTQDTYSYGMTSDGYWQATHKPCGQKSEVGPSDAGHATQSGTWGGYPARGTNDYMHAWVARHDDECPVLREQRTAERDAERERIRALNPHVKGI